MHPKAACTRLMFERQKWQPYLIKNSELDKLHYQMYTRHSRLTLSVHVRDSGIGLSIVARTHWALCIA